MCVRFKVVFWIFVPLVFLLEKTAATGDVYYTFPISSNRTKTWITYSNLKLNASEATDQCKHLGGVLTPVDEVTDSRLSPVQQSIQNGLRRIYIFYDPTNSKSYRYSTNSTEFGFWKSAKLLGHLWHFDLFSRQSPWAKELVHFCHHVQLRWYIANQTCDVVDGWRVDPELEDLYGGDSESPGYQTIYNYRREEPDSHSSRLTDVKNDIYEGYRTPKTNIYAADLKIYMAASKLVSDVANSTTNATYCQHAALRYNLNWSLTNVSCSEVLPFSCYIQDPVHPDAAVIHPVATPLTALVAITVFSALFGLGYLLNKRCRHRKRDETTDPAPDKMDEFPEQFEVQQNVDLGGFGNLVEEYLHGANRYVERPTERSFYVNGEVDLDGVFLPQDPRPPIPPRSPIPDHAYNN